MVNTLRHSADMAGLWQAWWWTLFPISLKDSFYFDSIRLCAKIWQNLYWRSPQVIPQWTLTAQSNQTIRVFMSWSDDSFLKRFGFSILSLIPTYWSEQYKLSQNKNVGADNKALRKTLGVTFVFLHLPVNVYFRHEVLFKVSEISIQKRIEASPVLIILALFWPHEGIVSVLAIHFIFCIFLII